MTLKTGLMADENIVHTHTYIYIYIYIYKTILFPKRYKSILIALSKNVFFTKKVAR